MGSENMDKNDIIYFIEKEYFDFQLNLGNNYKDLARKNFDNFVQYVSEAKTDGRLSNKQIKKYDKIVEKYTRMYNGEEDALDDKKYMSNTKKIVFISIGIVISVLLVVGLVLFVVNKLNNQQDSQTPVATSPEYPTKAKPNKQNGGNAGNSTVLDKGIEKVENVRQAEKLDRGIIAIATEEGVFVSWRYLGTDDSNVAFKLYRDGQCITNEAISTSTNYLDSDGSANSKYYVETILNGEVSETSEEVSVWTNDYLDVPIQAPAGLTMPNGETCTYTANDASVGDVDGDGEYEIILKWDPSNAHDNSHEGYTGNVYIDCYKMDGTLLWRVDLGVNIRAGAHYTQFMVYDYDGDGKAEMVCKTADGTVDGKGNVIGDASADYRTDVGRILEGPEFLTLFDGLTGKALDTIDYEPGRGSVVSWGDDYGNRCDRFLAATAYLDGEKPSVIMCRGYYTRAVLVAYDVVDKKLVHKWTFDSNEAGNGSYAGQGNHNLAVADVDWDGKDEIVYGQCAIDDNGKGLYSTNFGHGDAIHVSDYLPERDGLEAWGCLEGSHGALLVDAMDGKILLRVNADSDTGRAICGNFIPGNNSAEFVSAADTFVYDGDGSKISTWGTVSNGGMNYAIYWDGDLEQEAYDKVTVTKYDEGSIYTFNSVFAINGTKANASLVADVFGDWREEVMLPTNDNKSLRIFTTTDVTEYRIFTLMHDIQYRCQVAAQNVAYNQGAALSFFLGTGYDLPEQPKIKVVE